MARSPRSTRRGFTLVEVLVALAVFAIASVMLIGSYLNVLRSYQGAARGLEEDPDLVFARGQVMQIADLPTAEAGLEYDTPDNPPLDPARHVKWTADIEPFTGASNTPPTDLFTVTLTLVVSPPGGQPKTTVDVFNLLRPTWSEPAARSTLRQANASAILQLQGKTAGG